MRFFGMAGYYRKFCKNFSGITEPLTNLLKKSTKFKWNDKCQDAFDRLKAILKSAPVLLAPDFDKCFKLAVDASDVGIGAVLLQEVEKLGVRPEENWLYFIEWEANNKCTYLGRWENAIFSQMYQNTLLICTDLAVIKFRNFAWCTLR